MKPISDSAPVDSCATPPGRSRAACSSELRAQPLSTHLGSAYFMSMNLPRLARSATLVAGAVFLVVQAASAQQAPLPTPTPTGPSASSVELDRNRSSLVQVQDAVEREENRPKRRTLTETSTQELEFQDYVNRNYGKWLPVYGLDAFSFEDQGFDAPVNSAPSEVYEVGIGDQIRVKLSGSLELDANLVVDNTGFITLPRVGAIQVAGVRKSELQGVIGKAVARLYTGYSLHVYTGALRTISIYVVGHAARPGAYRVPATSTLINAMYASGGPNPAGSLRAVRLMRQGKQASSFDFYDVVSQGSTAGDAALRNGDVLHIPPAGGRVALIGAVNQQAIFELAPQGTSLSKLLQLAGGVPGVARVERITVDRVDRQKPEAPKQVFSLDLRTADAEFALQDGDVITVQQIGDKFSNMVAVRGSVYQPLRRPWSKGMRVSDLIPSAAALYSPETARARNDLAFGQASKRSKLPVLAAPGGVITTSDELTGSKLESLVPSDNINWNLATIERINELTGQTELVHFNLGQALRNPGGQDDLLLLRGDQIVVYGDKTLSLPEELRNRYVKVEGEVHGPGVYQLAPGETLKQLLQRAGGATSRAFPYGIRVTRASQVALQKEQLKKAAQLLEDTISAQSAEMLGAGTNSEQKSMNESLIAEIKRRASFLKAQTPDGRIAIEAPVTATTAQLPDFALEDGDTIHLPAKPSHVSVYGAVNNPITALWTDGSNLARYIEAAKPKKSADLSEVYVIRANGRAETVSRGSLFSSGNSVAYPGDSIFVPEEPVRMSLTSAWMNGLKDWSQVIFQMVIGARAAKGL